MNRKIHINRLALSALLLVTISLTLQAGTSHIINGTVSYPGGGHPPIASLTFDAFITIRPTDILDETLYLSGNTYYDEATGDYFVQCGAFSTDWSEGETFQIDMNDGYGGTASETVNLDSNPNQTLDITLTGSSLSVSLSSFQAVSSMDGITVEWVTESELDNVGYYISRSSDGQNYSRISNIIYGAGNTSERHTYTYTDTDIVSGVTYWYRLDELDIYGHVNELAFITVPSTTAVSDPDVTNVASAFALHACYPNPFNPTTTIQFDLPETMSITLDIFDSQGRRIRSLVQGAQSAGIHMATWDGTDDSGNLMGSGTYFSVLRSGSQKKVGKLLLMK